MAPALPQRERESFRFPRPRRRRGRVRGAQEPGEGRMVDIARKNLFHDRTRFLITVVGVTCVVPRASGSRDYWL